MVWEEPSYYFTYTTLFNCLKWNSFRPVRKERLRSDEEDLILILADRNPQNTLTELKTSLTKEFANGRSYSICFEQTKLSWKRCLQGFRQQGPIALFGVGHLSISFVNYFNLGNYIDFAVDDNEHKQGRFLPGSRIRIAGTDEIRKRKPSLVLLGFAVDPQVLSQTRWQEMIGNGVTVKSIFPGNQLSVPRLL